MTYSPARPGINLDAITTSEQLSGRSWDGAATYVKLIKKTGALGTGDVTQAHGITGATRWVNIWVGVGDAVPQWFGITLGTISTAGSVFGTAVSVDGTNVTMRIGTSWAATNALSNAWIILEYLK